MKKKFIVSMRVDGRIDVEVEAENADEAFELATDAFMESDLKEALNSYGIDIKKIWIPDFLWDYLTDEEKKELPYIH